MSGSSLDGLDIVFAELEEAGGTWAYEILESDCIPYDTEWKQRLQDAANLSALEYQRLHTAYGHYTGQLVKQFIERHSLQHRVQLIASHGHTVFHEPANKMTAQLGDGAAIAAATGINVVSDLRAMDIALGGQGAPIVPLGEKLLFSGYSLLLNLGGIANLSSAGPPYTAFDVCPANRVLNMIAASAGKEYDEDGALAAKGFVRDEVLAAINRLDYYKQPYPKSLANSFGTDVVYPMLKHANLSAQDAMRTMVEHICIQVTRAVGKVLNSYVSNKPAKILVTGGGAHNSFLVKRLEETIRVMGVTPELPGRNVIDYKEALIMALLGILRWREENTVLHSVTGASRSSIGGAVWMGQE